MKQLGTNGGTTTVISWNVNGIRSCYLTGRFTIFLQQTNADLIFLQEICSSVSLIIALPGFTQTLKDFGYEYYYWYSNPNNPHHFGVAVLCKQKPQKVIKGFLQGSQDGCKPVEEGRLISVIEKNKVWFGSYFPTLKLEGQGIERRRKFHEQYLAHINHRMFDGLEQNHCGDMNTTMGDGDLYFSSLHKRPVPKDFPSTTKMERDFIEKLKVDKKLVDVAVGNDVRHTFTSTGFPRYHGL